MNYQILDLETYKRKSHFEYFSQLAYPYVGVTADVEITELKNSVCHSSYPSVTAPLCDADRSHLEEAGISYHPAAIRT